MFVHKNFTCYKKKKYISYLVGVLGLLRKKFSYCYTNIRRKKNCYAGPVLHIM